MTPAAAPARAAVSSSAAYVATVAASSSAVMPSSSAAASTGAGWRAARRRCRSCARAMAASAAVAMLTRWSSAASTSLSLMPCARKVTVCAFRSGGGTAMGTDPLLPLPLLLLLLLPDFFAHATPASLADLNSGGSLILGSTLVISGSTSSRNLAGATLYTTAGAASASALGPTSMPSVGVLNSSSDVPTVLIASALHLVCTRNRPPHSCTCSTASSSRKLTYLPCVYVSAFGSFTCLRMDTVPVPHMAASCIGWWKGVLSGRAM